MVLLMLMLAPCRLKEGRMVICETTATSPTMVLAVVMSVSTLTIQIDTCTLPGLTGTDAEFPFHLDNLGIDLVCPRAYILLGQRVQQPQDSLVFEFFILLVKSIVLLTKGSGKVMTSPIQTFSTRNL